MVRSINRLTPRTVSSLSKTGRYSDGGGLYLQVSKFGTKAWLFRFTLDGRSREMGLGPIHTISLAEARLGAENCRKLVRDGIDPIDARKAEIQKRKAETAKVKTFRECSDAYIADRELEWKSPKQAALWRSTLSRYAHPVIGDLSVQAVDTALVLDILKPIWGKKTETATRVRNRIEAVLDWAKAQKYCEGENPARWKGHLDKILAKPSKVTKVVHRAALPYTDMGAFMAKLRSHDATGALAFEFLILTATRTSEVINAKWSEIDIEKKIWVVPEERTKMDKEHRVPLSPAAMTVLEKMKEVVVSEFVFPGARPGKPFSNMVFLQFLKRMKWGGITAHGFRSTFRDWAAERTAYPNEVAEMALAHAVGDRVEAAYRRGDLFEKRVRIMADWATFCLTVQDSSDKVVPIRGSGQ